MSLIGSFLVPLNRFLEILPHSLAVIILLLAHAPTLSPANPNDDNIYDRIIIMCSHTDGEIRWVLLVQVSTLV